ncbi:YgfZ/GcvT domain-containing protein [Bordetella bronchiseptica]|uniref:CAF17-like 4Fe-4S cluster assembly/insertion protein YgfZ n=1 Tax=Bordetella bronchiseptica TaxID=518 RepID=UPI00045AC2B6|nr:folate-binding protein YgfZ [Bordetella bronchiseptica]KDD64186.1 glycine cleavage T-protein [Bordetella bronchiseptica OSU553]AUL15702.1 folate-binding protein YgfZ [Bordetella bronchiseptica]AWP58803.1 folate-binding protein YgfZ [Bordetella bronchiseptica]AWQ05549.1 folate-binding protein YgfZ [Bordetella bronchiseptica]KAK50525.1 glycine cleavage T-protein [Bordetella bronchiseptica OSU054]
MHAFYDSIPARADGSAQCAPLASLRVIGAAGADALAFLHGQLTQDVTGQPADHARLAGYCTAKGRLLATLVMWRAAAADESAPVWQALVRADVAEAVLKRLSMFVLRAKARLAPVPAWAAGVQCAPAALAALQDAAGGALPAAPWQRAELPTGTWIGAPSADAQPRWWWIATEAQLEQAGALAAHLGRASESAWQAADLAAGLPWIGAATQDVFIPQTVNLDLIGGVSFTKGCYPGQEVVARSHYRGTVKRRMAHGVIAAAPADLPEPLAGQDIYDSARPDEPCGRVVDAARSDGQLALLFETTLASLPDGDLRLLSAQGPRIALAPLPYELAGNAAG